MGTVTQGSEAQGTPMGLATLGWRAQSFGIGREGIELREFSFCVAI
jgi:hypothetical protein